MPIEPNPTYPKQMNGPIISAYGKARDNNFADSEEIIKYLHNLSIDTAKETELESIGKIIGYLRPLVPVGFSGENLLIIGTLPLQTDTQQGLSTLNTRVGGQLTSSEDTEGGFMSLGMYRKFLTDIAIIKRYGITISSVDKIASLISNNYEISWLSNGDIKLHYLEPIGFQNIWILTQMFYHIATAPQIEITAETDYLDDEEE